MIERMRMDQSANPPSPAQPQYASQVHGQGAADGVPVAPPVRQSQYVQPQAATTWAPPMTDEGGWMQATAEMAPTGVAAEDGVRPRGKKYWTLWTSGMVASGIVLGIVLVLL